MSHRRLGTFKFILFGNPETSMSRVEITPEINDPTAPGLGMLVSRTWLLMLESQIGKVPKEIQDQVLDALTSKAIRYFLFGAALPQREKTPDMHHLGTLEIELCLGNQLFVLAHPRDFDRRAPAFAVVGLIMTGSIEAVCAVLDGKLRDDTLYALVYGLHKWATVGRPGWMTARTNTWDFDSMRDMAERGRELIQRGRMTNIH